MVLRIIAGPHPRWPPYLPSGTVGPNVRHASIVTIVDGLDHAPGAFIDLLRGTNTGKMLVRLRRARP
jgi:hypothetical protein